MKKLQGFPYLEVQFTKTGDPFNPAESAALTTLIQQGDTTDLLVISHGWNNDMADARSLYSRFFKSVREVLDSGAIPGLDARKYAILAVLWPSKKFADEELIPSGAASVSSNLQSALLKKQIDALKGAFDSPNADSALTKAKALVPKLEDSKAARDEFGTLLQSLVPASAKDEVDGTALFKQLSGDELIDRLSKPLLDGRPSGSAGGVARIGDRPVAAPAGGAAGIGSFFGGIISGARRALNLTTYYQMKERAGVVGRDGLHPLLRRVRTLQPSLRLHLIGHSFGGRLVTAATAGPETQPALKVNTLTLLQAAFSHYGFSRNYERNKHGFFRRVIDGKMVTGPILITCTVNDRAVGLAYPAASLLANQVASALGDKNSKYGGIGSNGAQKTPEAVEGVLHAVGGDYTFEAGKVYNLNSDAFVANHSDIAKDEIAFALMKSVATA